MKKNCRKVLVSITAACTALLLAACSAGGNATQSSGNASTQQTETTQETKEQTAESTGDFKVYSEDELKGALIYIITDTQQNSYFAAEAQAAASAAEDLGFTSKITSYESDINKEMELCDAAISEGAVAIIWDVADSEASITAVQKARDAGIPTFCTSRELNTTGVAISQIVADNAGGTMGVAEKFVEAVGEDGEYAELYGLEGDNNSQVRSQAYHSVIDQYPGLVCVTTEVSNFDMVESYNDTENILQTYPNIKGIVTANDTEALGAWQACVDAGRTDIVVVGVDGSDEVAASIKEGGILATALQPCAQETMLAVQQAYDFLTTGSTGQQEKQIVASPVIDESNCDKLSNFYLDD